MAIDRDFWDGRRVLVTGHTGFKGAWLTLWLQSLGARVTGVSGGIPSGPSLYQLAEVGEGVAEHRADIRDAVAVAEAVREAAPEVVFHLAAQPMVLRSLRDPLATYATNVMGTVAVLDCLRSPATPVRAAVFVTSDKCYANDSRPGRAFREGDPLGGHDPYSSSKACAELAVAAYRSSFFAGGEGPRVASARAGNVIGGGDWGEDRLTADAVRAVEAGTVLDVRRPQAVRPWQHVLKAVGGYLMLAQAAWEDPQAAAAWNFGPESEEARSVSWVLDELSRLWDGALRWQASGAPAPAEASYLALDSSAARNRLGWQPAGSLQEDLRLLVQWHRSHLDGADMRSVTLAQIEAAPLA